VHRDFDEGRHGDLEHIREIAMQATLPATKQRSCAGCGGKFTARELGEVTEDHESLTWFPGGELCRECACGHGVL